MYYTDGTCETGVFQDNVLVEETGEMNGISDQSGVMYYIDGSRYEGKQCGF